MNEVWEVVPDGRYIQKAVIGSDRNIELRVEDNGQTIVLIDGDYDEVDRIYLSLHRFTLCRRVQSEDDSNE